MSRLIAVSEPYPALTTPCADPIVEAVRDDLRRRSLAGQAKYGMCLDRGDLALLDWLQHAYEEGLDQCLYLRRAIWELQRAEDDGK